MAQNGFVKTIMLHRGKSWLNTRRVRAGNNKEIAGRPAGFHMAIGEKS
jgi:hypothetical protein